MTTFQEERKATLFAILSYTIFGFSLLFFSKASALATPFVLLATRFIVAFIIINVMQIFKGFRLNLKGKKILPLLFLGLVQPIAYFLFESFAVKLISTSLIGVIQALCPVLTVICGVLLLKEKISLRRILCVVASVFGVILVTISEGRIEGFNVLGLILAIGSVISATCFNLLSRKVKDDFSPYEKTYVMFAMGSVLFTILALISIKGDYQNMVLLPFSQIGFWIDILYLGGLSSVGAFFFINYAYSKMSVSRVTIYNSLITFFATIAGVVFLKESFGLLKIIGSIIVVLSITVSAIFQHIEDKRS